MKKALIISISIFILIIFSAISSFHKFSLDKNKLYQHQASTNVYSSSGALLFGLGWNRSRITKIKHINPNVIDVFLQAEDADFFKHSGFSISSIMRAMMINIKNGKISQGGSTISQQVIKMKYLNREKTILRKIKELFLTIKLEEDLEKAEILEIYLNNIFLGHRNIGIVAASEYYFSKKINNLSYRELSFLASVIPAPSRLSNYSNPEVRHVLKKKIDNLLLRLYRNKKISLKSYNESIAENLSFAIKKPDTNLVLKLKILEEIENKLSINAHQLFGYKVFTSIDSKVQKLLSTKLSKSTDNKDSISGLISIRPSGRIAAYAGFISKDAGIYDMVSGSARSIEALITPFVYAFALEQGFHLSSDIYRPNKKLNLKIKKGGLSMISAFDRRLTHENMRLIYKLGISPLSNYLKNFNFNFEDESELFSGKLRMSLFDLATAYNSFNNNGLLSSSTIIDRIIDNKGKQIYTRLRKDLRATDSKANQLIKNLIQSKSKKSAYCVESDESFDFVCIDIHNKLSSISWVGSIKRKNRVSDRSKEILKTISFKKNTSDQTGKISYFLMEEEGSRSFVPHFL